MKLHLRKPSPAMVVACISLFVALSGAGTAAVVVLKKNQVRSIHIAPGQVKKPDVGANAINSTKVRDGSLLARDFAAGQLPKGEKGDRGPSFGDTRVYYGDGGPGSPPLVVDACGSSFALDTTLTVATPSRIYAESHALAWRTDPGPGASIRILLQDSAGAYVANTLAGGAYPPTQYPGASLSSGGVLATPGSNPQAFVASPGTYTLHVLASNLGTCGMGSVTYASIQLSYILLGTA